MWALEYMMQSLMMCSTSPTYIMIIVLHYHVIKGHGVKAGESQFEDVCFKILDWLTLLPLHDWL